MSTRNKLIVGIVTIAAILAAVMFFAAPAAPDGISAGQVLGVEGINNGGAASGPSAPTVPGPPTIGTATGGNAQVSVAFTPGATGGSPITGFTATCTPSGTGTGASSPIAVTGLTNGTAYTCTVTATNAVGTGAASAASNSVTPATVPGAPTIGTATAGNASATVAFTAPGSNGGSAITGYTATSTPSSITGTGASSPTTVSGLANGTAYTFTVTATNAVGTGAASAASNSVTPSAGGCTAATNFLASSAVTSEWVGTATVATTVMTVSATTSGTLTAGQAVTGAGITAGTTVSSLGTYNGTSGAGTVNLSTSNTVAVGETVTASMATTNNAVITTAICNMVTNGVGCSAWSGGTGNVDRLYVMAASDGVSGVVDWCGHGVATKNGTCTFTANTGWNGDGSSCYFATGFVPSTAGGNWTQNSAVIAACDLTSRTTGSTTVLVGGIGTGPAAASYFFPRISTTFGADLDGNTFPSVANTNAQGSWIVSRTGSTNFTVYLNGSSFSTLSSTSFGGATTAAMPMLAYNNNGTIADFSTDVVGYVYFGGGETSTAAGNMYNALHTLMAALGNSAC